MKRNRIMPRGGDGFYWLPTMVGGLTMSFCFPAGAPLVIVGLVVGLPLFAYGLYKLCDFDDIYRD
jgi:hypothetical protein